MGEFQRIETAADQGLINCALIKANQIGSLYETLLAMLVALGKGLELVVSTTAAPLASDWKTGPNTGPTT